MTNKMVKIVVSKKKSTIKSIDINHKNDDASKIN